MIEELMKTLGVSFHDPRLLQNALLHSSLVNEQPHRTGGLPSNERLEFLGDATLNFLTAAWLYERFPDRGEGKLTTLRAALVRKTTLARFARSLNLGKYVRISRGEETRCGRDRPSLLADAFEAVLGAIYLDHGLEVARAFIDPFLEEEVGYILSETTDIDDRTRLQKAVQKQHGLEPEYRTIATTGPPHRRQFTVEVWIGNQRLGFGYGFSKQEAAQEAARSALEKL